MSNDRNDERKDEDLDLDFGGDDDPGIEEDVDRVVQIPTSHEGGTVFIQNGVSKQTINLNPNEVLRVGDVRTRLGDVINIAPNAIAAIMGKDHEVNDDQQLLPNDTLVFVKRSASKG